MALLGQHETTPESVGIFRIFKPNANPVAENAPARPAGIPVSLSRVPLPRSRPLLAAAVSDRETLTLAASRASKH